MSPGAALDVAALLLHKPPMRLLLRVLSHAQKQLCAEAQLASGGPFDVGGTGDGSACLELVAQAAALLAARASGDQPIAGRLASCRELVLHAPLPLDVPLLVRAEQLSGDLDFASFRGEVRHKGRLLAEAQLTVVLSPAQASQPPA